MDNRIYNRANSANSLQISIMGKVEAVAEFSIPNGMGGKEPFLLEYNRRPNTSRSSSCRYGRTYYYNYLFWLEC